MSGHSGSLFANLIDLGVSNWHQTDSAPFERLKTL